MVNFGFHMSVSGKNGYVTALQEAEKLGLTAMQIFAKSPRSWTSSALDPKVVSLFKKLHAKSKVKTLAIHSAYLVNLGATDELWKKSIESVIDDLKKAEMLNIDYVVVHPGSGSVMQVKKALKMILHSMPLKRTQLLLENVAGGGQKIGARWEELRDLIEDTPLGICLDTCHTLAAGYPLQSDPIGVLDQLEKCIELKNVPLIHFNDSKGKLGSKLDRHANLMEGHIGSALKMLLLDKRLQKKTFIMETRKEQNAYNLKMIQKWLSS